MKNEHHFRRLQKHIILRKNLRLQSTKMTGNCAVLRVSLSFLCLVESFKDGREKGINPRKTVCESYSYARDGVICAMANSEGNFKG